MHDRSHTDMDPSPLLVDSIRLLPKGRALDVAMGRGRNSLYLAGQGFEVDGVELNEDAVRFCREEAQRRGVSIRAQIADLTRFRIPRNRYDLILCFYYLQRDLIPQMKAGLKPGGVLVYETFLIDQHLKTGSPKHREYCFERNELLQLFRRFRILYYREGFISEDKAVASLVAEKRKKV